MTKRRPAFILILVTVAALAGCVSSGARDWAQTAPALPPDTIHRTSDDVHLGVWPTPPARDEQF